MMARGAAAPTAERLSQRRNYHENIVEHYENPRNVGSLDKNSDDVGTVSWWEYICVFCVDDGDSCISFWGFSA